MSVLNQALSFENHLLKVDKINLKTTALLAEGAGAIDLDNVQCDVNLTLRSTNEKYKKSWHCLFALFDSCYSPQYKVNIDQNFRHQLKELREIKIMSFYQKGERTQYWRVVIMACAAFYFQYHGICAG